jgi:hypothetical protein
VILNPVLMNKSALETACARMYVTWEFWSPMKCFSSLKYKRPVHTTPVLKILQCGCYRLDSRHSKSSLIWRVHFLQYIVVINMLRIIVDYWHFRFRQKNKYTCTISISYKLIHDLLSSWHKSSNTRLSDKQELFQPYTGR